MRIGLIGCGWIAETHLESLSALGEQVACVCDPDPQRLRLGDRRDGRRGVRRLGVAARARPARRRARAHAAAPAPRGDRRGARARAARSTSRSPSRAISTTRGRSSTAAERTGVVCAIGYQWRAIDWVPDVRELFAERALGLLAVRMFGATAGRTWFTDQAAGGGQVLERASHGIDLVQAIAGPAVRVSATGANVPLAGADRPADSEIDDVLALTLELERGARRDRPGRLAARRAAAHLRARRHRRRRARRVRARSRVPRARASPTARRSTCARGAPSARGMRALPGRRARRRSGRRGLHARAGDRVARDRAGLRAGARRAAGASACRRARLTHAARLTAALRRR